MQKKIAAVGVLFAVALVALPSRAHADEASRSAMEHFRRGTRAYDLGHFTEAAAEYEKAYEAKENPALLYNLGQAYRGAGEHQKALNAYRAYLRNAADAPNRQEVVHFIEALKHTIEVQRATTEKPPVGTLPAAPPPPTSTPQQPLPVVIVAAPTPPAPKREPDARELALGKKLRIAGLAVGAFGVGALVAGGVFAGYTASVNRSLNDPSAPMPTYNHALENKGRIDQALETAFFVVGGVAVATGVTALVAGTLAVKRNRFALAPIVGPTRLGASLRVSF